MSAKALLQSRTNHETPGNDYAHDLVSAFQYLVHARVAHVAFGSGFEQSRVPDAALKGPRGVNRSQIHVDVMIGCDELEVVGVTAQGQRVPVLEAGTWVLS